MTIGLFHGLAFLAVLSAAIYGIEHLRGTFRTVKAPPPGPSEKSRLRLRVARMARASLLMVSAQSPGFSKIGGHPELPVSVAWPQGEDGPLAFVCQIDIDTLQAKHGVEWLPATGRLYLFFDDALNGMATCGKIIFSRAPPGAEVASARSRSKSRRFGERRVDFKHVPSFPSEDWLGEAWPAELKQLGGDAFKDADIGDLPDHRVGGFPSEIQSSQMALECEYLHRGLTYDYRATPPDDLRIASRQWRLLIQIDSDPALHMNWWDGGRLYVFARVRDMRRGDFTKTVTITQTY